MPGKSKVRDLHWGECPARVAFADHCPVSRAQPTNVPCACALGDPLKLGIKK